MCLYVPLCWLKFDQKSRFPTLYILWAYIPALLYDVGAVTIKGRGGTTQLCPSTSDWLGGSMAWENCSENSCENSILFLTKDLERFWHFLLLLHISLQEKSQLVFLICFSMCLTFDSYPKCPSENKCLFHRCFFYYNSSLVR